MRAPAPRLRRSPIGRCSPTGSVAPLLSAPMTRRPPSRRVLAALAALGVGAIALVACSGSEGPAAGSTTTTTTAATGLEFMGFSDPSQTVTVEVGRRFAIVLPADPAHGWRWVVEPVDIRYLAPLGSEFRDDPALLAQSTTTTTAPPPPETTTTLFTGRTTTTTAPTSTTAAPTTTTTAPGPLVQVVSYAGRSTGTTKVTLHYERIGGGAVAAETAQTVVFNVVVGTPAPVVPPPG